MVFARSRKTGRNARPTWLKVVPSSLGFLVLVPLFVGCVSPKLERARNEFYRGEPEAAAALLEELPGDENNRILYLMERGTIRQSLGDHKAATADWQAAADMMDQLDYYSLSKGAASWVANDNATAYRGMPFEQVLMRALAAQSYFAMGLWDDAAVEGRNIVGKLENLNGFPGDTFSRYLAAFAFEMIGDREGAQFQYRVLSKREVAPGIDAVTGRFATILLMAPREVLYEAIDARLDRMIAGDALAEVAALEGLGLDPGLPAMKAVGVAEFGRHLRGEITLDEARRLAKQATRNYAKRQVTWFRHQMEGADIVAGRYSEDVRRRVHALVRRLLLTAPA